MTLLNTEFCVGGFSLITWNVSLPSSLPRVVSEESSSVMLILAPLYGPVFSQDFSFSLIF